MGRKTPNLRAAKSPPQVASSGRSNAHAEWQLEACTDYLTLSQN